MRERRTGILLLATLLTSPAGFAQENQENLNQKSQRERSTLTETERARDSSFFERPELSSLTRADPFVPHLIHQNPDCTSEGPGQPALIWAQLAGCRDPDPASTSVTEPEGSSADEPSSRRDRGGPDDGSIDVDEPVF